MRTMGLATVMALTLTAAVGVTSASAASSFLAGGYPAIALGTATETGNQLSLLGQTIECDSPPSAGVLGSQSATLSTESENGTCHSWTTNPLKMNGCSFTFDPGDQIIGRLSSSVGPRFGGTFSIGPKGCGPITTEVMYCKVNIDPGAGFEATAEYWDRGEGTGGYVEISAEAKGLDFTSNCGNGSDASYTPNWKVAAKNVGGAPLNLQVAQQGVYLSGYEEEEAYAQPIIEAESYSKAVSSTAGSTFSFTAGTTGTVECAGTSLSGELTKATNQLNLGATYGECNTKITEGMLPTTVTMNSCKYALGVQNVGPPYAGNLGVSCSKENDAIEFKIYLNKAKTLLACTIKAKAQAGLGSVSLSNVDVVAKTAISANANVTGVKYERSGGCGAASPTDGVIKYSTTLAG